MVWKVVGISNAGTSSIFGSDDLDKIAKLLNGVADIDNVDLNSITHLTGNKFRVWDVTRTHYYNIVTQELTANRDIGLPIISANTEFATTTTPQTITNKIIDAKQNSLTGVLNFPSKYKTGYIDCTSPTQTGTGLLDGHTKMGTPTVAPDADGSYWRFSTGTTVNTQRGFYKASTFIRRDYDPIFSIKWRETAASNNDTKLWIGFTSIVTTIATTATAPMIASDRGFMIGHSNTDTAYRFYLSDGTGSTITNQPIAGTTKNNSIHEVTLRFANSLGTAYIKFDALDEVGMTTELPASTAGMTINVTFQNTGTISRDFDVFWCEMTSIK